MAMNSPNPVNSRAIEDKAFWLLVVVVSVAFAWILWPFYGAIFWAAVLAVLFTPVYRNLASSMRQRRTPAALLTVLVIFVLVILPSVLITSLLVQEALAVFTRIKSGDIKPALYFQQIVSALPSWLTSVLDRFELTNLASLQQRVSDSLSKGLQVIGAQAFNLGQNTFDFIVSFFIMLYLLFFLLRDGETLAQRVKAAVPLRERLQRNFAERFATVIRATVKGNIVIAIIQGTLGGIAFWFLGIQAPLLWGVVMAFLSRLPAVGAAIVWIPVAGYLFATHAIWQGIFLIVVGVGVIGLVDNFMRPILVGKDTQMPDYVILISTVGGIAIFGINGFVIGPVIAAMFMASWDVVAAAKSGASVE